MHRRWFERLPMRIPENGDGGGGGGGGQPQGNQQQPDENRPLTAKELAEFRASVGELTGGIKQMIEMAKQRQEQLSQGGGQQQQEVEEEQEVEEPSPQDLETMDRAQYAQFIVNKVVKEIGKVIEPVEARAQNAELTATAEALTRQVNATAEKYEDFWQWKDEIKALAKESPGLSPERLYKLARAENPDKAKDVDEKLAKEREKKGQTGDRQTQSRGTDGKFKVRFGGFTPNGSGGETGNRKMSPSEAASAAWDMVTAELGTPDFQE